MTADTLQFEILDTQNSHQGFFQLNTYTLRHELYQGGWSGSFSREILERGRAVAVLLHDPATDQVLLVEQFRAGAMDDPQGPWMLEIVAGIVEPGEQDDEVARRETLEEAGCILHSTEYIMDYYPTAGGNSEVIGLYYAPLDLASVEPGVHGLATENEDIRTLKVSRQTALDWLKAGKIKSSMAIIGLQWLALNK